LNVEPCVAHGSRDGLRASHLRDPDQDMRSHRSLIRLLLILALIAGQQAALVHAVSHLATASPNQTEPGLPHGKVCGECLTSAHFAAALPSGDVILPAATGVLLQPAQAGEFHLPIPVLGFQSRAPPALL
jgi:hypothetical protein